MTECHFEFVPIDCVECGSPSEEMGTCRDIAYCPPCRARMDREETLGNVSAKEQSEHYIFIAETTPYIGTTEEEKD